MRNSLFISILLMFSACSNHAKKIEPVDKDSVKHNKTIVSPAAQLDTSFSYFLNLFRPVSLPFHFDDDSILGDKMDWVNDVLVDSLGQTISQKIIPKSLVKKWLLSNVDSTQHWFLFDALLQHSDSPDLDQFYFGADYTIQPFVRITDGNRHILLLKVYKSTDYIAGGYTTIFALRYSATGQLEKSWELGRCGDESWQEREEGTQLYAITVFSHIKVKMASLSKVRVTISDVHQVETDTYEPVEKHSIHRENTGKTTKVFNLLE